MFRTDNAMGMTLTAAGQSASDDDEDEIEDAGLPVVVVLKLEVEVASDPIDGGKEMLIENIGGFIIPGFQPGTTTVSLSGKR